MRREVEEMKKVLIWGLLATALAGCNSGLPMRPLARAPLAAQNFRRFNADAEAQAQLFTTHFVKAYGETIAQNEPIARQDPNGPARALLNLIASAQSSLDAAFYDLGDMEVAQALIQAAQRGVRVRLVTDSDNMLPKLENGEAPANGLRDTIVALQQAGVPVVDDKRSAIMHHKFVVVDNQVVWMGSTNSTSTSLYQHNNNAITIRNPLIAENYLAEFERMFTQKIFGPNPPRQIPHPVVQVGNTTIRTFFSPKGGGKEAILDVLGRAQKRLAFMTFSFTDKDIAGMMIQKKQAGLRLDGVYDQCLGYGQYSTYHLMRQNGVYTRMDGNEALLHHKVILADDTVITGSFNFSASADKSNNESMLIIENSYVSATYWQEYERVMTAAKNNRPPKNKCPGQDNSND